MTRTRQRMNHVCRAFGLLFALAVVSGCTSIEVSQVPGVDFTAYKTYAIADPLGIDEDALRAELGEFLVVATQKELDARGLQRSDDPDLTFDWAAIRRPDRPGYRPPPPGPINSGIGRSSGWSADSRDVPYEEKQTRKDTFTLKAIDRQSGDTVWTGELREYVTSKSGEGREIAVAEVVNTIVGRWPGF